MLGRAGGVAREVAGTFVVRVVPLPATVVAAFDSPVAVELLV